MCENIKTYFTNDISVMVYIHSFVDLPASHAHCILTAGWCTYYGPVMVLLAYKCLLSPMCGSVDNSVMLECQRLILSLYALIRKPVTRH